jgi:hypothetical protein
MEPVLLAASADASRAATLGEYRAAGGYRALERALKEL